MRFRRIRKKFDERRDARNRARFRRGAADVQIENERGSFGEIGGEGGTDEGVELRCEKRIMRNVVRVS